MNMYGYEIIRENDLTHHGIKGQKWGVRRFQNDDGTLTDAGKKRYYKDEYRQASRNYISERNRINEKYDKKKTENAFGFNGKKVSERIKGHLENEYKRSKELNKLDQKKLDAKRQYRTSVGKKKVDTFLMRMQQKSINDISKQTQSEFNKEYAKRVAMDALSAISNYSVYSRDYDS